MKKFIFPILSVILLASCSSLSESDARMKLKAKADELIPLAQDCIQQVPDGDQMIVFEAKEKCRGKYFTELLKYSQELDITDTYPKVYQEMCDYFNSNFKIELE